MASTLPVSVSVPYSSRDCLSAADELCYSNSIVVLVVAVYLRLRCH